MDNAEKLIKLKAKLSEASQLQAKLSGQLEQSMQTLQEQFGVSNLKEAKDKLNTMIEEKEKLEEKINELIPVVEDALSKW